MGFLSDLFNPDNGEPPVDPFLESDGSANPAPADQWGPAGTARLESPPLPDPNPSPRDDAPPPHAVQLVNGTTCGCGNRGEDEPGIAAQQATFGSLVIGRRAVPVQLMGYDARRKSVTIVNSGEGVLAALGVVGTPVTVWIADQQDAVPPVSTGIANQPESITRMFPLAVGAGITVEVRGALWVAAYQVGLGAVSFSIERYLK